MYGMDPNLRKSALLVCKEKERKFLKVSLKGNDDKRRNKKKKNTKNHPTTGSAGSLALSALQEPNSSAI